MVFLPMWAQLQTITPALASLACSLMSSGDHNIVCDRTGFVFKRSECREEWNGLMVHKSVWEPRHPQDVLRPKPDNQSVDIARPEPRDPPQGTAFNIGNVI